jgi:hypothetical protein
MATLGTGEYRAYLGKPRPPLTAPTASLLAEDAPPKAEVPRAGLRLWLRADRGVTETGGRVTEWQDQSGHGYHAVAANGGASALARDAAHPGLPCVEQGG